MSEQTLREALKELCDCCSSGFSGYVTGSPEDAKWEERKADAIDRAIAALSAPVAQPVAWQWLDGAPPKPWSGEWFLAETIYGDRVVLRELPNEFTYDFKTADETYIMRERIKRWAQFPDSLFTSAATEPKDKP